MIAFTEKELTEKLDAIADALGLPRESWRIAGCDLMAHMARDAVRDAGKYFYEFVATAKLVAAAADGSAPARPVADGAVERDAARFVAAIALEDNAETLYAAVISHTPDTDSIRVAFDEYIQARKEKAS